MNKPGPATFDLMGEYYDRIYAGKDYQAEAEYVLQAVAPLRGSSGSRLLDVACGTGRHMEAFRERFEVEGLDVSTVLLEQARRRLPDTRFHLGDMRDFDLGARFDVVTSLFSAVGYMRSLEELGRAIGCMALHLAPGGVLVVEPWFTPQAWLVGATHAGVAVNEPDLKLVRANSSLRDGRCSIVDMHYLVVTPTGTTHHVEHHVLGLFTVEEMMQAFRSAGLDPTYDAKGPIGRGLYLGRRPSAG